MTPNAPSPSSASPNRPAAYPQLIGDYAERMARHQQKITLVLRLLRDEIWTSVPVLSDYLGVSYSSAHRITQTMAGDGLVTTQVFTVKGGRGVRNVVLLGITHHGLAHAWSLNEVVESRGSWEPSKVNALYVPHVLEVQQARIRAERCGWSGWAPGRMLANRSWPKVPDALAVSPEGKKVAVEVERHIKSQKRYEVVIGSYITQMKQADSGLDRVDYLAPSNDMALRLARTFGLVKSLRTEGKANAPGRVAPLAQAHLDRFRFYSAERWPEGPFALARLGGGFVVPEGDGHA